MLDGFTFSTPSIATQLNGKLAALKSYNALQVPNAFFFDAMTRLREKYLNISLEAVPHPASAFAQQAAKDQQIAAGTAPAVQDSDLTAQQWFEQGFDSDDTGEKLRCYNKVIELKPGYSYAYRSRGQVRHEQGDLDGALQDFAEAMRLEPSNPHNYSSLGIVLAQKGKFDYALSNMNEAVRREPAIPFHYFNRGLVKAANDDLEGAIRDLDEAIRIEPLFAPNFYDVRGRVLSMNGDFDGALKDYSELIRLLPNDPNFYGNRALVLEKINRYSEVIRDLQKYLALGGGRRNGDQTEIEELIDKLSKQLDA